MTSINIGTSGWNYDHWKGTFYPEELDSSEWLDFYQERFTTIEVNNSFYKLPEKDTLRSWSDTVNKTFTFSMKASRYTTHMKKLSDPEKSTEKMFSAFSALKKKLGPILFQLPPNWNFDKEKLEQFLSRLPEKYRYVFEFRDHSWISEEACGLLEKYNAAFCIYDLTGYHTPDYLTADFVYVRLHGPDKENKYRGKYNKDQLSEWAERITQWQQGGRDVYLYFNNDMEGFAPENAQMLQRMVSGG